VSKLNGAVDALVRSQTKELRLPTVGARYGELADQAAREGLPHRDYLAHLFDSSSTTVASGAPSVASRRRAFRIASGWRTSTSSSRRSTPLSSTSWPAASTSPGPRT
jgi:hypothetical protein